MLRVDSPTLVRSPELFSSAELDTVAVPVPDRDGTFWMPAAQKIAPSRDFASAAGAMTVVQDRQALVEALKENPMPSTDHGSGLAPWGDVVRDMTHDSKSLVYLPLIVVAGLLVMLWIFKVNGPDAMNYQIVPRLAPSAQTTAKPLTPAQPSHRHRKTPTPEPSPSRTKTRVAPVQPSPGHSEAPAPKPTQTVEPQPTPRHTDTPRPEPKPTQTVEPEPKLTKTSTPDPEPTVQPTRSEPSQTAEPTREPTREPAQTTEPVTTETPRS